jgi:bifunctional chitinase/lysozyme
VADGAVFAPPARVEVFAAAAGGALPVASASAPKVAAVDVPVTLDGTGSAGSGGLVYQWRQVSGPAAGLTRADRAAATVVLFQPGAYEFELAVADAAGTSMPSRVRIEGRARGAAIPVAVASAPASAHVGDLVLLDARGSNNAMRYRWTQVAGPWVVVEQGSVGSFVPKAAGTYGFELEVDDGAVRSAPVRINVVVTP